MMHTCLFCDSKMREVDTLYETENFFVKIGIAIVTPGHIMIISKNHYSCFGEMPPELDQEFNQLKNKVFNLIQQHFSTPFLVEFGAKGQSVFHAHIHFILLQGPEHLASTRIVS